MDYIGHGRLDEVANCLEELGAVLVVLGCALGVLSAEGMKRQTDKIQRLRGTHEYINKKSGTARLAREQKTEPTLSRRFMSSHASRTFSACSEASASPPSVAWLFRADRVRRTKRWRWLRTSSSGHSSRHWASHRGCSHNSTASVSLASAKVVTKTPRNSDTCGAACKRDCEVSLENRGP